MTEFLAEAFKRMVGLFAGLCFLGSALGGLYLLWALGPASVSGWLVLIGGPLMTVLGFGVLALQIQNNTLLKRLAEARPASGRAGPSPAPSVSSPVPSAVPPAPAPGVRIEPILRAPRADD